MEREHTMGKENTAMAQADTINEFVRQLEAYGSGNLNYPLELGELLRIVDRTGMTNDFDELIFQAKFLVKSQEIMQRIGPGTEGFERFSTEFQTSVKNAMARLKLLVDRAPQDIPRHHFNGFLSAEESSIESFLRLASDLRWIKNWQLDGMPLPYDRQGQARPEATGELKPKNAGEEETNEKTLVRVRNSGALAAILVVLLMLIDPPATTLGWTLSIVIVLLLAYIVLQLFAIIRGHHRKTEMVQ